MTYAPNGNLETMTDPTGTTTFTWDARNRLIGLSAPTLNASFTYDAFGRRVQKAVNGQIAEFQYDMIEIVRETVGGSVFSYINGPMADERLIRFSESEPFSYVVEVIGNVVALVDSTGNVTAEYRYDPFGNASATGPTQGNPFTYTGRESEETGLYYLRTRYYNPSVSRFLSEDPIRLIAGDTNLYVYARNSPLTFADPLGLIAGGYGVEANAGLGVIGGELSADLVADPSGNVGIAITVALLFGPQAHYGAGRGPVLSTVDAISDFEGEGQGFFAITPAASADLIRKIDPKTRKGTKDLIADVRRPTQFSRGWGAGVQGTGTIVIPIYLPAGLKNLVSTALLQAATRNVKLRNPVLGAEPGLKPVVLGRRK